MATEMVPVRVLRPPVELGHIKKAGERNHYETTDARFFLVHERVSWWSGSGGKRHLGGKKYADEWTAIERTAPGKPNVAVAKAHSLVALRAKLARYIADESAGCVKPPHSYGLGS